MSAMYVRQLQLINTVGDMVDMLQWQTAGSSHVKGHVEYGNILAENSEVQDACAQITDQVQLITRMPIQLCTEVLACRYSLFDWQLSW